MLGFGLHHEGNEEALQILKSVVIKACLKIGLSKLVKNLEVDLLE